MSLPHEKQRGYRPDIDGLRSVAVLSVFLFHLWPDLLPGGYLGVDVFFVISGYLITGIIVRENSNGNFSFRHFYARRVKRIFPALFFIVFLTAVMAIILLTPETYINYMKSARYTAAQLANFFFARKVDYFAEGFSGQPLLHAWSLGVEEQFYLVWPLLIFLSFYISRKALNKNLPQTSLTGETRSSFDYLLRKRFSYILIIIALLSAAVCYLLADSYHNLAFYMFYSRAFEFCFGGILALNLLNREPTGMTSQWCGLLGLVLLCYSFLFIGEGYLGTSFLRFGVLLPCLGASLLIFGRPEASIINRVLAGVVPVFIGRISYSLYLVHWPVIIFWKIATNNTSLSLAEGAVIIFISFLISTLMYYFLELPARKSTQSDKTVLLIGLILIILFTTTFKLLETQDTAAWRVSAYDQEKNMPSRYAPRCREVRQGKILFYQCQPGEVQNTPTLALVGDSHSVHYIRPVTAWAKRNGYNVKYLGSEGCAMLVGEVRIQSKIQGNHEEKCSAALPVFNNRIVPDPLIELVFIAQRFDLFYNGIGFLNNSRIMTFRKPNGVPVDDHPAYYEAQLKKTVETLRANGKDVVLLKQVPILADIKACDWQPLLRKWLSLERECSFDDSFISQWQSPSVAFVDRFAAEHQIETFDPMKYFDTPLSNGRNMYSNRDHINTIGSLYLTPFFDQEMLLIMARIQNKSGQ